MIQIVTYSGREHKYNGVGFEQYSLHDIKSLDEYEFTIIDLGDINLWRNNNNSTRSINDIDDLCSISEMIERSEKTTIILILPQNIVFNYEFWSTQNKYLQSKEIKNMLHNVTFDILGKIYQPITNIQLIYENTTTEIDDIGCRASFYFANSCDVILKSKKSNKPTAIKRGKSILTTLLFLDSSEILKFLSRIGLLEVREEMPQWLDGIHMFDDIEQKELICECQDVIDNMQEKILLAETVLTANDRMKSILYTNGDELVNVVFDILEEMMGCDLSEFIDEKKEDFLFHVNDYVFIGEIKGVNHNVKNENISQLDLHYQGYLDEHEDVDVNKIKALLIINHQRKKDLTEREKIKDTQVKLAERNGSLIIETYTLLRLLEKYRKK